VATAALTGTLPPQAPESVIPAGGKTVIITLGGAFWIATLGQNNQPTQDLINGFTANRNDALGWNNVVKPGLTFTSITRNGDKVATLLLPAFGTYDIPLNEIITVTLPDSSFTLGEAIGVAEGLSWSVPIPTWILVVVTATDQGYTAGIAFSVLVPTWVVVVVTAADQGYPESIAMSVPIPTMAADAILLYEKYQTGDDVGRDVFGVNWEAQTFTPGANHTVNRLALKITRALSPGTVTLSIRATAAGLPTGADLASLTFDGSALPLTAEWRTYTIGGVALTSGTKYAIVVRATGGDASNKLIWRADQSSPTYSVGARCSSTDSGGAWTEDTLQDYMFEEGVGQL
jgi:hypothetical protein